MQFTLLKVFSCFLIDFLHFDFPAIELFEGYFVGSFSDIKLDFVEDAFVSEVGEVG